MSEVTRVLSAIEQGDANAAEQLLPLVYDELRKLAVARLAQETPGQTLQATALVHEAYLRLVGRPRESAKPKTAKAWGGRGHFFAAAAESMRRILVECARQKASQKRGGRRRQRLDLDQVAVAAEERSDELLALDEALGKLEQHDARAAQLVKLRYFAGLSHQEAAQALGITRRAADRLWALARAWLYQQITDA
jgi:RNA polymerase sigma factor (TIGR02999 family)